MAEMPQSSETAQKRAAGIQDSIQIMKNNRLKEETKPETELSEVLENMKKQGPIKKRKEKNNVSNEKKLEERKQRQKDRNQNREEKKAQMAKAQMAKAQMTYRKPDTEPLE